MSRVPAHTVENAPEASRALLEGVIQFSPTGKPLNLHAQMAHSPAVLAAYTSLRRATAEHGMLGPQVASALMLATAGAAGNEYALAITARLALSTGWPEDKVAVLRRRERLGDPKIDALVNVATEAAAHAGHVSDTCWKAAKAAGRSGEHLTEAFAYLGLTLFTAYFLNYAETELDLPTRPAAAQGGSPEMELVQARIVTDDQEAGAAFYTDLAGSPVPLNQYYAEVPTGGASTGFSRSGYSEEHCRRRPAQATSGAGRARSSSTSQPTTSTPSTSASSVLAWSG